MDLAFAGHVVTGAPVEGGHAPHGLGCTGSYTHSRPRETGIFAAEPKFRRGQQTGTSETTRMRAAVRHRFVGHKPGQPSGKSRAPLTRLRVALPIDDEAALVIERQKLLLFAAQSIQPTVHCRGL